ncbi:MAG: hypothetical protein IJ302_05395, partial [Clostridia bacterium]|nr:hypothetical protein [Clostridia bacterium]
MQKCALSLFLGLLLLSAASCGEKAQTDSAVSDTPAVTETEVTTEALPYPEYTLDLGGENFHMIYFDAVAACGWASDIPCDIDVAEQTGEALADAVYNRNRKIEELYNCTITAEDEDWDIAATVNRSVMAGDGAYDAIFPHWQVMSTLITQGSLLQLDDLIDVSQPWWDEKALEGFSVMGKTYAMCGDMMFMDKFSDIIIMFNKQMADNYDLGDIYTMVVDKKWTFDTMYEMC